MGWSGGTEIGQGVWDAVKQYIPEDKKREVAKDIVDTLESHDWDNVQEVPELYNLIKEPIDPDKFYKCWDCETLIPGKELLKGDEGSCPDCGSYDVEEETK